MNEVSSLNFTGKYTLNANQSMPSQEACLKRDSLIGFWTTKAKDGDKVYEKLKNFFQTDYNKNPNAKLDIILEIPDAEDKNFEESMKKVGQNFSKLV